MSDLANKLNSEAKAYKLGGKKKILQLRNAKKIQTTKAAVQLVWKTVDDLVLHFKKFVGYLDENGDEIPGIAFPPPIDEKGVYLGILKHELEGFKLCWNHIDPGVMFKWARGYGKTFLATWFIEFTMYYFGYPWMYLSSTEILSDVAFWIFQWATRQHLIIASQKGGKKNTYTSFTLSTGGRMRIYDYLGEELVGQHGWYIAMDDIIKKKWEDRPSDNLKAARQWFHSIQYIRRMGLLIFGTRKFQGDLLEVLENVLVPKGLHINILVPYIMEGDFPDWTPMMNPITGRELLSVPELYTWEELESKKIDYDDPDIDPLLAWQAEMMQNPMPKTGGLAEPEDIVYVPGHPSFKLTRCCGIGVDLSWSENQTSDNSAVESCVMYADKIMEEGKRPLVIPKFCFVKSSIGRFPVRNRMKSGKLDKYGVLETIQAHWNYLRRYYPGIPIIVAIERNGGGIVVIEQARRARAQFPFANNIIQDSSPAYKKRRAKDPNITVRLGITHSKEKVARIFGELSYPIRSGQVVFHERLRDTDLIDQITTFPRGRYKDGPDAAGMIKDELNKKWSSMDGNIMGRVLREHFKNKRMKKYREDWIRTNLEPWNDEHFGKGKR